MRGARYVRVLRGSDADHAADDHQPSGAKSARLPRRHTWDVPCDDAGPPVEYRFPCARRPPGTSRIRSLDRVARLLGNDRRRPHLLSGADRQRGLPAHRHRAVFDPRARTTRGLHTAPGSRRIGVPRVHAREEPGQGDCGHDPQGRSGDERAGARSAATDVRNIGRSGRGGAVQHTGHTRDAPARDHAARRSDATTAAPLQLHLEGATLSIKAGDRFVLVFDDGDGGSAAAPAIVQTVTADAAAGTTTVSLVPDPIPASTSASVSRPAGRGAGDASGNGGDHDPSDLNGLGDVLGPLGVPPSVPPSDPAHLVRDPKTLFATKSKRPGDRGTGPTSAAVWPRSLFSLGAAAKRGTCT